MLCIRHIVFRMVLTQISINPFATDRHAHLEAVVCVCACSFWIDELLHLNVWLEPLQNHELDTEESRTMNALRQ